MLLICRNPKAVFLSNQYDFSKFYEEVQYLTQQQALDAIAKLL